MHMKKSIIGLAVVASSFFVHADEIRTDKVDFSLAAERSDLPTLTVGAGGAPMKLYFDFVDHKFKTIEPMALNIALHNPDAAFTGLQLKLASVTANGHALTAGNKKSVYDFYMGSKAGSDGTFMVPHGNSASEPFTGVSPLTSAELGMANLGAFDGVSGGHSNDIIATTYVSLESTSGDDTLTDDTYSDNASLHVQTNWVGYAAN